MQGNSANARLRRKSASQKIVYCRCKEKRPLQYVAVLTCHVRASLVTFERHVSHSCVTRKLVARNLQQESLEKNSALNGVQTGIIVTISTVLVQLSYQANWEPGHFSVQTSNPD